MIISFESVSSNVTWDKLFPKWVNETNQQGEDLCPKMPMPAPDKYIGLDVVVAKLPCGDEQEEVDSNGKRRKEGIRDVNRLQVSLATGNIVVENGMINKGKDVYAVFIAKCEPMVELFRCEDLVWHSGDYWVYKPNIYKLKEVISMPLGSCALAHPNHPHSG